MEFAHLQQLNKPILLHKDRYFGSFPNDYVLTLDDDTFAILNKQHRNMQCEHWIKNENSCPKYYFADFFVHFHFFQTAVEADDARVTKIPSEHLWLLHAYTAFHFFQFRQEEIIGIQDIKVLSF